MHQLNVIPIFAQEDDDDPNVGNEKLTFVDLYHDAQLLIVEECDIPQLIALAETSKLYSSFLVDIFRRKHLKNKTIKIVRPFYPVGGTSRIPIHESHFRVNNDSISMSHFGSTLKVLRHFGSVITKLYFVSNVNVPNLSLGVSKIFRYINAYCSDSLINLEIESHYDVEVFEKMTKPFKYVESMSIVGSFKTFDSDTLAFEELFPELCNLKLTWIHVHDKSVIDRRFPNLDDFSVLISKEENNSWQEYFQKLLTKNRQIQGLTLNHASRSFLKFISEHQPNLKRLHFEGYFNDLNESSSPIVLSSVENFTLVVSHLTRHLPDEIYFSNLVEFNVYAYDWENGWIDIVHNTARDTSTFKILKVWKKYYSMQYLSNHQLERLAAGQQMSLDDVQLKLGPDVSDQTILNFVRMNANAKRILLSREYQPDSFHAVEDMIQVEFGDQWNITRFEYDILFESNL